MILNGRSHHQKCWFHGIFDPVQVAELQVKPHPPWHQDSCLFLFETSTEWLRWVDVLCKGIDCCFWGKERNGLAIIFRISYGPFWPFFTMCDLCWRLWQDVWGLQERGIASIAAVSHVGDIPDKFGPQNFADQWVKPFEAWAKENRSWWSMERFPIVVPYLH